MVIFDIHKMQARLFLAFMIMTVFTVLYITIPREEFGISNNYDTKYIGNLDILQFSIYSQICTGDPKIYPNSLRTRVLTMCQLMLGYGILLI